MKHFVYIIYLVFAAFILSCSDDADPVAPQSNVLFSKDSLYSPGNDNVFSVYTNGFVGVSFSLKTNTSIPPGDESRVYMELLVMSGYPPNVVINEYLWGNNCNGDFGWGGNINAPGSIWCCIYADTSDGHNYSITMKNIIVTH